MTKDNARKTWQVIREGNADGIPRQRAAQEVNRKHCAYLRSRPGHCEALGVRKGERTRIDDAAWDILWQEPRAFRMTNTSFEPSFNL